MFRMSLKLGEDHLTELMCGCHMDDSDLCFDALTT